MFPKSSSKFPRFYRCMEHLEAEVCLDLGFAKTGNIIAQRYELIGERCKYLYPYEVTQNHRFSRSDER